MNLPFTNHITACALHPGTMMGTSIVRDSGVLNFFMQYVLSWFTKDMDQGSSTTLTCCLAPVTLQMMLGRLTQAQVTEDDMLVLRTAILDHMYGPVVMAEAAPAAVAEASGVAQ